MNDHNTYITLREACKMMKVTRQAVALAFKKGRLTKYKKDNRIYLDRNNVQEYLDNKYSRKIALYNGELLYDPAKGECSVQDAAHKLGLSAQKLYYAIRRGRLNHTKKGGQIVLFDKDVQEFEEYLSRQPVRWET